jgi:MerR family transcriptional regulator, light-induced transcriptional regulator
MAEVQHSIKVAARRCGLTTHVIRIWEKRYDAVSPDRTDTNRRLYSEDEIERLNLLRLATETGHSISNVAKLPTEQLRKLVEESLPAATPARKGTARSADDVVDAAVDATRNLGAAELEDILARAAVVYGHHGLLENVVSPFAVKVGDLWREGVITAAHEHFASAVIRNFLIRHSKPYAMNGGTPVLVVGTPAGQLHEIGAVMAAAAANDMGWRVIYLGTSLPAVEIAGAAIQNKARAVALSLVFPGDDPNVPAELENLRRHLPAEIKIIAGGRAADSYALTLKKIGAIQSKELREFYPILERLRMPVA